MRLSSEHKRFLLSEQLIAPAAINFLANGAISWLSLKNASEIRYWAASSIGPDLLMTGFLLPFIMCMINSRLVAGKVYSGALDHIPPAEFGPDGWHRKPILVRHLTNMLVTE